MRTTTMTRRQFRRQMRRQMRHMGRTGLSPVRWLFSLALRLAVALVIVSAALSVMNRPAAATPGTPAVPHTSVTTPAGRHTTPAPAATSPKGAHK